MEVEAYIDVREYVYVEVSDDIPLANSYPRVQRLVSNDVNILWNAN